MAAAPSFSRVALVEDDAPFRAYVAGVLRDSGRYQVVAQAGSAAEAATWPPDAAPDVALIDVVLPGASGVQVARDVLARFPRCLAIMVTGRQDDELILESIRAGAVGYVLKGDGSEALLTALDDARSGGAPMSSAVARRVLALMRETPAGERATPSASRPDPTSTLAPLTPREHDVLSRVAAGATDKETAAALGVSVSAVKQHLANIYAKWRVRSRTEAAITFTRARR